jgi:hypothetical protein
LWIIAKWLHHKIEPKKNTPELNVAISPNKSSVTSLRTWSGVRDWWMLLLLLLQQQRGRESPGAQGQNYALLNNPSLANFFTNIAG